MHTMKNIHGFQKFFQENKLNLLNSIFHELFKVTLYFSFRKLL